MGITFKEKWCNQAFEVMSRAHPEWPATKLKDKIEKIYDKKFYDPGATLANNYLAVSKRTTLSSILILIINKIVVLGGDGCLFVQHAQKLSFLAKWIKRLKAERKSEKKQRDMYPKNSPEWSKHDLAQNNKKALINSLYGILGYMRFHLFNVNIAQSITATGQAIISTATCAFENFLSDNIKFISTTEIVTYIININKDFEIINESNKELLDMLPVISIEELVERLKTKIGFCISEEDSELVLKLLFSLPVECWKLIYYKNNLEEFLKLPFMIDLNTEMLNEIQVLRLGEISAFDSMGEEWNSTVASDKAKDLVIKFRNIINTIVLYDYPIYDKVRRTKYTDKKSVLYIDTDSNFLSIDKYVRFNLTYLNGAINKGDEDFRFKSVSLYTIVLFDAIAKVYSKFTDSLNIAPEYGKILNMKNEFFFDTIVFGSVKKRYYGRMLIQEGKYIAKIEDQREIKGFDFIKSAVKSNIRKEITAMIDTHVLLAEKIDLKQIMREVRSYEKEIEQKIYSGDNSFFRQLTVQQASRYASPLTNQGFKSAFIWNSLNPLNPLEFPAEVDIIPLNLDVGMTEIKYHMLRDDPEGFFNSKQGEKAIHMRNFYYNYPEVFNNYRMAILLNPKITYREDNVDERGKVTSKYHTLVMTSIAKPRTMTELPDWIKDMIDINKITNNIISLINPVLEPLGSNTLKTSTTTAHYSNIVDI